MTLQNNRRKFLQKITLAAFGLGLTKVYGNTITSTNKQPFNQIINNPDANNEEFWAWVRQSFSTSSTLINLNNGGVSPQPLVVQEAFNQLTKLSNEAPSYYMWRVLDKGREALREKIAHFAGCQPEELVITRNTTESLETITFGLDLKKGDEVILSPFDYPNMKQAWIQRQLRDGIVIKWVTFPQPCENEETIVEAYRKAINPKTKLVHITHVINWTGQIMPVKKIADLAHQNGAEVLVGGAHTFKKFEFKIDELGADYFGTSLHKWLCAPFGTGLLYIKKEKIGKIWPLFSPPEPQSNNIRKFEAQGTRSFPAEFAIANAIDFHLAIGTKRKQERLHFLKTYWLSKAIENPKINSYTSLNQQFSCAIATIGIEGIKPNEISQKLQNNYHIHTTVVDIENVSGVRITPHIYTQLADLDKLITALNEISVSN